MNQQAYEAGKAAYQRADWLSAVAKLSQAKQPGEVGGSVDHLLGNAYMYYGILLTGGGGLLRGLDQRLREETGVAVNVSPTALENVVTGCAKVLEANALSGGFVQNTGN